MGVTKPKYEPKEKEDGKPKFEAKPKKKLIEGVRGIVRVAEVDLAGEKKVRHAILRIKGVGPSLAYSIPRAAGLNPDAMVGALTNEEIDKLEDCIKNPAKYGIPIHMTNRRSDPLTGGNRHLVSSELSFAIKSDIDIMKKSRSYKGIRHELGLPVRGQRTRSSFRTGALVGVAKGEARKAMKVAVAPAKLGAPAAAPAAPPKAGEKAPAAKASAPAKKEEKK